MRLKLATLTKLAVLLVEVVHLDLEFLGGIIEVGEVGLEECECQQEQVGGAAQHEMNDPAARGDTIGIQRTQQQTYILGLMCMCTMEPLLTNNKQLSWA